MENKRINMMSPDFLEKFVKLERFKSKDIGSVLSWVNDEAQMVQWAGPIFDWPVTQKQFRTHLKAVKSKFTLYPFGLYYGSKIIGYCELAGHSRKNGSATASRIIISPRRRNKGLGLFMLTKLLEFGFNEIGLNRIGLAVFDFNKSAIKCYKNAGFVFEGTLRQSSKVGDSYWNCHLMSILRKEWLAKYKGGNKGVSPLYLSLKPKKAGRPKKGI